MEKLDPGTYYYVFINGQTPNALEFQCMSNSELPVVVFPPSALGEPYLLPKDFIPPAPTPDDKNITFACEITKP